MTKPEKKINLIQYLLSATTDEILDGTEVTFSGDTERDRNASMVKFIRIRGLIQRFSQALSPDDNETLIAILKGCIVQKIQE